jgi:hypothetical protein
MASLAAATIASAFGWSAGTFGLSSVMCICPTMSAMPGVAGAPDAVAAGTGEEASPAIASITPIELQTNAVQRARTKISRHGMWHLERMGGVTGSA